MTLDVTKINKGNDKQQYLDKMHNEYNDMHCNFEDGNKQTRPLQHSWRQGSMYLLTHKKLRDSLGFSFLRNIYQQIHKLV